MTDTEVVPVGDDRAEPLSYRRIDILLSVVTTLLGVTVIVVAAVTIPESAAAYTFDPVGPRGFAFVIGALTTALGAVLVVNRLLAWRRIAAEGIDVDEAELGGDDPRYPASSRRAFAIIAVTFVYAVLLNPLGYIIASALHVAACTWVMGGRSRSGLIVFPIAYAIFTWAFFGLLLDVRLPAGMLEAPLDALGIG
jgi:putative tricarboxylic transport membrane protein